MLRILTAACSASLRVGITISNITSHRCA